MRIRRVCAVYFSAVGNTARVASKLADYLASAAGVLSKTDDFTTPNRRDHQRSYGPDDLVVFAVPTYAGRVPNKILPFVQTLFTGSGTPAVPVVTFGNRSCGSSLTELRNELEKNGFHAIAAASVVCHHAFADIGQGRPGTEDFRLLKNLSGRIIEVLENCGDFSELPSVKIGDEIPVQPYYTPLGLDGQPARFLKAKPVTDMKKCSRCGMCAEMCPMGSISFENPSEVPGICIKCQACIAGCPQHARYFDDPAFLSHRKYLEKNYRRAAKTEIYCQADSGWK